MKLSEMPLEEIRQQVGSLQVRSDNTGKLGRVVAVSAEPDRDDYTIDILWSDDTQSFYAWHFWLDKVTVL